MDVRFLRCRPACPDSRHSPRGLHLVATVCLDRLGIPGGGSGVRQVSAAAWPVRSETGKRWPSAEGRYIARRRLSSSRGSRVRASWHFGGGQVKFQSFFMAGVECATGSNALHQEIDQVAATQHDVNLDSDYRLITAIGMQTVREGVRWPKVDRGGKLDFSDLEQVVRTAHRPQTELILDLFHYGFPEDLDILGREFGDRFEAFCAGVARVVANLAEVPIHFTPVNEPSYFSWAGGEAARFAPYLTGRAMDMKIAMIGAAIRGVDAIRAELPRARMVNVDPICRVAPPFGDSARDEDVRFFNEVAVFECWDMLCGKLHPELGGTPQHLDIVGINYYWTNQWEIDLTGEPLSMDDPRLTPLGDLIRSVWERYRRPMIISETSHVEHMRGPWLRYVGDEVEAVRAEGIPLEGICIY